eukprot:7383679-Prymnesium_polylepis.2
MPHGPRWSRVPDLEPKAGPHGVLAPQVLSAEVRQERTPSSGRSRRGGHVTARLWIGHELFRSAPSEKLVPVVALPEIIGDTVGDKLVASRQSVEKDARKLRAELGVPRALWRRLVWNLHQGSRGVAQQVTEGVVVSKDPLKQTVKRLEFPCAAIHSFEPLDLHVQNGLPYPTLAIVPPPKRAS